MVRRCVFFVSYLLNAAVLIACGSPTPTPTHAPSAAIPYPTFTPEARDAQALMYSFIEAALRGDDALARTFLAPEYRIIVPDVRKALGIGPRLRYRTGLQLEESRADQWIFSFASGTSERTRQTVLITATRKTTDCVPSRCVQVTAIDLVR